MVYRFTMCARDILPHTNGPGINYSNVCTLWTMHGMCLHTCACVLTPVYVYIGTSGTIPII